MSAQNRELTRASYGFLSDDNRGSARVNRYFFNFRHGDEIAGDYLGMYLHDLDEAREEAIRTCHDLLTVAELAGELPCDCEVQVADASGEPLLTIPFGETRH
jgi:hypothetical protein